MKNVFNNDFINELHYDKKVVFVFSTSSWNEPARMRKNIALQISKYYKVIYVNLLASTDYSFTVNDRIHVIEFKNNFCKEGKFLSQFFFHYSFISKMFVKLFNELESTKLMVFNFCPFFRLKTKHIKNVKLILFFNDDFIALEPRLIKKLILFCSIKTILKNCKLVITSSFPLAQKGYFRNHQTKVLLSGSDNIYIKPKKIKRNGVISCCYMGFLNKGICINTIERLLKNAINVCLIGVIENNNTKQMLSKYSNIVFQEALEGEELYVKMNESDVFIMPFKKRKDRDVVTVPAKLYQMLSLGKPIVYSNLPNLIDIPKKFVYSANSPIDFLDAVKNSHSENCDELVRGRIELAKKNSWDDRGRSLFKIINTLTD